MPKILVDRSSFRAPKRRALKSFRVLNLEKFPKRKAGNIQISLAAVTVFTFLLTIFLGVLYLYQVNSIAASGYEIKKIENNIRELNKDGQNLKIKEMELRSMYNIEKSTEDLNLVNLSGITYVEIEGPVAMNK